VILVELAAVRGNPDDDGMHRLTFPELFRLQVVQHAIPQSGDVKRLVLHVDEGVVPTSKDNLSLLEQTQHGVQVARHVLLPICRLGNGQQEHESGN
jgi:hypothetical protein